MSDIESNSEEEYNSDDEDYPNNPIVKKPVALKKSFTADIENEEEDLEEEDLEEGEGEEEPKVPGDEDEDEAEDDDEDYYDDTEDEGKGLEDDEDEQHIKKKPSSKAKQSSVPVNSYDYDEDDDDDDDDENYLQKFDSDINKNYILDYHPECLHHNYDEITSLSRIVRDKDNIIIDPLHKTIPILTKYERARILGQRAKQIESGAKPLVKVPDNIIDGYLIAELELREKKIPFVIKRPLPDGSCEYWNVKDLEVIIY
jgi:DNA-directed RNA polymerase I, II, and III subunit RPABC2